MYVLTIVPIRCMSVTSLVDFSIFSFLCDLSETPYVGRFFSYSAYKAMFQFSVCNIDGEFRKLSDSEVTKAAWKPESSLAAAFSRLREPPGTQALTHGQTHVVINQVISEFGKW